ncbi:cytochrome d ubiquinol oxidase subunit II [Variovorax sp. J22R133]|uniref:cytochrome d ubiquinol oxidase subunit II n=1 Tax=Variovorax brevis TaxID=3053503 RepID=UPI002574DD8A|nr:cytochrome d ubiquinol oxidase subunit II [Variovorax sp. J22R133]MDM0115814.1 cytochrome d ubiquinol oxidase subunit II [Variovorax sp. J22R133]
MVLHELISYDVLRMIWWLLVGVLLVGYAVMDGFDLGVGMLLPFAGRNDLERRVVINSVGPVWEGNQVWLVVGGGMIFAAWPQVYAVSFSGMYVAMFAILLGLILRPVGFKFRSKRPEAAWRARWDWVLCFCGVLPTFVFGVAMGNVLQGVPFRLEPDMQIYYTGTFMGLFSPFAVLCGLVSIAMLLMHGAAWLQVKSDGQVAMRARRYGSLAALLTIALYVLAGMMLYQSVMGYQITSPVMPTGPSNPLLKSVGRQEGAWFANYAAHPHLFAVPALGIAGAALAFVCMLARRARTAFLFTSVAIAGIVLSVGASMFPFILPSSIDPRASLTVWDSSSSHLTLFILLVCAAIFLPIIMAYTSWVYSVMRGKVDAKAIAEDRGHAY